MSDIFIVHGINFVVQIVFDILLKFIHKVCTDSNKDDTVNFFGSFLTSIQGSTYKILFYCLSSIILLLIFRENIPINSLILFFSLFLYIFIHFKIQYIGC